MPVFPSLCLWNGVPKNGDWLSKVTHLACLDSIPPRPPGKREKIIHYHDSLFYKWYLRMCGCVCYQLLGRFLPCFSWYICTWFLQRVCIFHIGYLSAGFCEIQWISLEAIVMPYIRSCSTWRRCWNWIFKKLIRCQCLKTRLCMTWFK